MNKAQHRKHRVHPPLEPLSTLFDIPRPPLQEVERITNEEDDCERPYDLFSQILPSIIIPDSISLGKLFIGELADSMDENLLRRFDIKKIIRVHHHAPEIEQFSGIEYVLVQLIDGCDAPIGDHFERCYGEMDVSLSRQDNVLVHCQAGRSRAPTIVISFIMKKYNLSFDDSHTLVRRYRPIVDINLGFQITLESYEDLLNA